MPNVDLLFKFYVTFNFVYVCICLWVCVGAPIDVRGIRFPCSVSYWQLQVTESRCWESNWSPLGEQPYLSSTEPSLQPVDYIFK